MPRIGVWKDDRSAYWQAGWHDSSGGYHQQSTRCRDIGAARIWYAAREVERVKAQAGLPVSSPTTLNLATAEYVSEREAKWAPGWLVTVEGFFKNQVLQHFGKDRSTASITRADVERFHAAAMTRRVRGDKPVSPATVNRMMAALAAFGEWCLVEGRQYHTSNPWAGHEPLPEDDVPVPELEEEQIDRLLAALEGPKGKLPQHGARRFRFPWRALVEFSRETGMRKGELGRLDWEHINERDRIAIIPSTRKGGRNKGRKMRVFHLSTRAMEILDDRPGKREGLVWGRIPDGRRAFSTAAKAAGLSRVWLHLARHLFASRLAERGAGRADLREAGGWSSSRMVDRYIHARTSRLKSLVDGPSPGGIGRESGPGKDKAAPALPEPP